MRSIKRVVSGVLTLCLLAATVPSMSVTDAASDSASVLAVEAANVLTSVTASEAASDSTNSYGHEVTYTPLTKLQYGEKTIKFFDASMSQYPGAAGGSNMSSQYTKLTSSGYSLNKFGSRISNFNTKNAPQTFNGNISEPKDRYGSDIFGNHDGSFSAHYLFSLPSSSQYEYFFGANVHGWHKTSGFGTYHNQHEKAIVNYFGSSFSTEDDKYLHSTNGGGYQIAVPGNWSRLRSSTLYFNGQDNDGKKTYNEAALAMGMVLGRDVAGPRVESVTMTDSAGNSIPDNLITLDWLEANPDRTIYFTLRLSEAVRFATGIAPKDVRLKIRTIGIDGTEGMLAEAHFLEYAPTDSGYSATDKTSMTFEYQVPDPYTDSSQIAQERGFLYDFTKININASDNKVLFEQMYDLSGNKASTTKNNTLPSAYSVPVNGKVDLLPLAVSYIDIERESSTDTDNEFIKQGELLKIKVEFNKALNLKYSSTVDNVFDKLPSITLNITENGTPVTITPTDYHTPITSWSLITKGLVSLIGTWEERTYIPGQGWPSAFWSDRSAFSVGKIPVPNALMGADGKSVTYYYQVVPGRNNLAGDRIAITAITPADGTLDKSGYKLMRYAHNSTTGMLAPTDAEPIVSGSEQRDAVKIMDGVAMAHPYKLDFDAPYAALSTPTINNGVMVFEATVTDANLIGCDANFNISFDGTINGDIEYKPSNSAAYDNFGWLTSTSTGGVSCGAPITPEGKAYLIVKLPNNSEISKAYVTLTATDEAGNMLKTERTEVVTADSLAPRINIAQMVDNTAAKAYKNFAQVNVEDINEYTVSYVWSDYAARPADTAFAVAYDSSVIRYTANDLTENRVYYKTLWVRVTDAYGNTSYASSDFVFDATTAEVIISSGGIGADGYPQATVQIKNSARYWYGFAETTGPWTTFDGKTGSTAAEYIRETTDLAGSLFWDISGVVTTGLLDDTNSDASIIESDTGVINIFASSATRVFKHIANGSGSGDILDTSVAFGIGGTSRPVELVVGILGADGLWRVESVLFDTRFLAPDFSVEPIRYSSNDNSGNRFDEINTGNDETGLNAADGAKPFNLTQLNGFEELELRFKADNATGIERINDKLEINIWKTKYKVFDSASIPPASAGVDELVTTLELDKDMLVKGADGYYTATIAFDPALIETGAYEIEYETMYLDGGSTIQIENQYIISYEFKVTYYGEYDIINAANFVFDNSMWGMSPYHQSLGTIGRTAVFDASGNDVTNDIPVASYSMYRDYDLAAQVDAMHVYLTLLDYQSPTGGGHLGTGLSIRTSESVSNGELVNPNVEEVWSFTPTIFSRRDFQALANHEEKTIYYQIIDTARGITTPIQVVKVRRDNTPPVVELSVSAENDTPASEVIISVSEVYDRHQNGDGTWVVDTPASEISVEVFAYQNSVADGETNLDILRPESDGSYRFIRNGYIMVLAQDAAGNPAVIQVNGTPIGENESQYYITNIDNDPPTFTTVPVFTPNRVNGSFTLSAAASSDTVRAYLQFDKAYTEFVTGQTFEGDAEIPRFEIGNIPGQLDGTFNAETGATNATVYIMDGTPLSTVTLIIEDVAGNAARMGWDLTGGLYGVAPKITNTPNDSGAIVYNYGGSLTFSVPVKLVEWNTAFATNHGSLPIHADGPIIIAYTDLFGRYYTETIIADIFGGSHTMTLNPSAATNQDVTVTITPKSGYTVSGTDVTVNDGVGTITVTANGNVNYTITRDSDNVAKDFSIPITNIDKTVPTAVYIVALDSAEVPDGTGETEFIIYSATYTLTGFSEDVTVEGASSITFDRLSESRTHTFTFRDVAGNAGTVIVDASDIVFTNPADTKITGYRLTYLAENKVIGNFTSGDALPMQIGYTNADVSVKIEALNASGDVVPSTVSESVLFTCEADTVSAEQTKTVTLTGAGSDNSISVTVTLPAGVIDKQSPTGSVIQVPQADGNMRVYLTHTNTDLAEDGVKVVGQSKGGIPFALLEDSIGYYVEFTENGTGYFLLLDRAGNYGMVDIKVIAIDIAPPVLVRESWSSLINAASDDDDFDDKLNEIFATPTNRSIKLFLSFNEQIARADWDVYTENANDGGSHTAVADKESYVSVSVAGNTVTVEILQNCQLSLTVYDIRGNATQIWRPESGPITAIDKSAPTHNNPAWQYDDTDNTAKATYEFNEPVTLTQSAVPHYDDTHMLELAANGAHTFTFADKAGNVVSIYPIITGIVDSAPTINAELSFEGTGTNYTDESGKILFTSKDAVFSVTAQGAQKLSFTRLGGKKIVGAGDVFTVTENGVYTIAATDKWGQTNSVNVNLDLIDKTPPSIRMSSAKAVEVAPNTAEDAVKAALLQGVTATDDQSGVYLSAGLSVTLPEGINLTAVGSYTAIITAADNCGNRATITRKLIVTNTAGLALTVNGGRVSPGDVFVTDAATISVDTSSLGSEIFTLYYAEGYKTSAQMKYAEGFTGSFRANEKGYYTIAVQSETRERYMFYVYIY